ncbi:flagellar brake protein YcgR [mine drainage metagenome]|uniref:Flagellar brake protein YcgR n=1 Tax=mine drainage metagenome TaxID=410659 RepID=A0A1J5RGH5_9ZZZZ
MAQETKLETNSDDDKKFIVNNRKEILRILRGLAQDMATVSAVFSAGKDILLTAVVAVDPESNVIYLDTNSNNIYNDPLIRSKRTIFVSVRDGARIQWISTEVGMAEYDGREAFRVPIPETLRHVQKRGLFRIETPRINPVMCKIPLAPEVVIKVPLVDICAEGIGVTLPENAADGIEKGATFENCSLDLPEVGIVPVNLIVTGVWEITLKNGAKSRRAGFGFVDAKSATQSRVQRYINVLQRNRITNKTER